MNQQNSVSNAAKLRNKLPYPLHSLADLAYNSWWSWSCDRLAIFRSIDPQEWEQHRHNPVKLLKSVSQERLAQLATEPFYLKRVETLANQFQQYLQATDTWAAQEASQFSFQQPIAYLSIEYGFHPYIPTYAGGLGILAAEHIKSASDLGLPVVGIGLLYRQGYFRQRINLEGAQEDYYIDYQFEDLPLELCRDEQGVLTIEIQVEQRPVRVQMWQLSVGRTKVYLLDTNREDNPQVDRWITGHLYGGDDDTRLVQEYLLGIGGVRALKRLGYQPQVYHLNEGHAAFTMLEVARQEIDSTGKSFDEVAQKIRSQGVFTTHTPVPAGHDTFSPEAMERTFSHYWTHLGLARRKFLDLGRRNPQETDSPFNMTVLALRLCGSANGVSKLNEQVCREMWSDLYPDRPTQEVPIGSITNGVHVRTWTAPLISDLYTQYLAADWAERVTDKQMWQKVDEIPDEELWWRHQRLKERLVAYVRSLVKQARHRRGDAEKIAEAENILDPKILTIGFARRFSAYKRGDLLLWDSQRAKGLLCHASRPVQIIFAGKAHPADTGSQEIIKHLLQWSRQADAQNRLIFLEDYDQHIAEKLVQGVDVWLNTPERPKEASGTSGQKAALNGGVNCSILDGWWNEAYQASDRGTGYNGWAIGDGSTDADEQNRRDAQALYQLLEAEIIPCYYNQDAQGMPHDWIAKMKASIKTIAPYFNTDRMVKEYVQKIYLPLLTAAETKPVTAGVV